MDLFQQIALIIYLSPSDRITVVNRNTCCVSLVIWVWFNFKVFSYFYWQFLGIFFLDLEEERLDVGTIVRGDFSTLKPPFLEEIYFSSVGKFIRTIPFQLLMSQHSLMKGYLVKNSSWVQRFCCTWINYYYCCTEQTVGYAELVPAYINAADET